MRRLLIILSITFLGCTTKNSDQSNKEPASAASTKTYKIQVLNVGFFHFGSTSDATKVDFDENNAREQEEIRKLSIQLAKFKPTIICLEYLPEIDDDINKAYNQCY